MVRPAAPLLQLLHLCMSSGKIVFGSGCAVALLAYLASVGPVPCLCSTAAARAARCAVSAVRVWPCLWAVTAAAAMASGAGAGSSTASLNASDGPMSQPGGMLLEKQTGDLFRFDDVRRAWMPVGNVGVHCSLGAISGRPDAQVGTGLNRSDGIGPCELTQAARFHLLFHGVWPAKPVPEANEWHCHLPPFDAAVQVPTGIFGVSVLAMSRLGAQVIECRNAVAVQFCWTTLPDRSHASQLVSHKLQLIIGEGESAQAFARDGRARDAALRPRAADPAFARTAIHRPLCHGRRLRHRSARRCAGSASRQQRRFLASKALGQAGATAAASRLRQLCGSARSAAGAPRTPRPLPVCPSHQVARRGPAPRARRAGPRRRPRGSSAAPTTSA